MYDHDECKKLHSTYVCFCVHVCVCMCDNDVGVKSVTNVMSVCDTTDKCASCLGRTEGLQTCHPKKGWRRVFT